MPRYTEQQSDEITKDTLDALDFFGTRCANKQSTKTLDKGNTNSDEKSSVQKQPSTRRKKSSHAEAVLDNETENQPVTEQKKTKKNSKKRKNRKHEEVAEKEYGKRTFRF